MKYFWLRITNGYYTCEYPAMYRLYEVLTLIRPIGSEMPFGSLAMNIETVTEKKFQRIINKLCSHSSPSKQIT